MDPITGAVVIMGLQKVGGPTADVVKDFVGRILAPAGDALGSVIAHPVLEWQRRRVERGAKLVEDAATIVSEVGAEAQVVPPRVLWPILERGSVEDDGELQQRWVNLLANAAVAPETVMPAFASILSELSPREARLLHWIDMVQREERLLRPSVSSPADQRRLADVQAQLRLSRVKEYTGISSDGQLNLVVANLQRLKLADVVGRPIDEPELHALRLKTLGRAFVAACTRPANAQRI